MQPTRSTLTLDPESDWLDEVEASCITRKGRRQRGADVERAIEALATESDLRIATAEAAARAAR